MIDPSYQLIEASRNGDLDLMWSALRVADGPTREKALIAAARYGQVEAVRLLLDQQVWVRTNNDKPLREAAWLGREEVVRLLLARGADVRADNDYALRWAVDNGHQAVVQIILDHIFRPDIWKEKGMTAAHALMAKLETALVEHRFLIFFPMSPNRISRAITALHDTVRALEPQCDPYYDVRVGLEQLLNRSPDERKADLAQLAAQAESAQKNPQKPLPGDHPLLHMTRPKIAAAGPVAPTAPRPL